jgi:hypothetical protein
MAITRSQQAKQLLQKGGRAGFFSAGLAAGDNISPGTSTSGGRRGDADGPNRQQKTPKKQQTPKKKPKKTNKNTGPSLNPFEKFRLAGLKNLYDQKAGLKTPALGFSNILKYADPSLDFYESTSDTDIMDTGYGLSGKNLTDMDRLADAINLAERTGNLKQSQFEKAFYGPEGNKFIPDNRGDGANIIIPPTVEEIEEEIEEKKNPIAYRFMADGGRAAFQEGGIFSRIDELGNDISSAEQELTSINQRLDTAQSSLGQPSGGGGIMDSSIVPDAPAVEATPFPAVTPDAPIADNISVNPAGSPQNTAPIKTVNPVVGGGRVPGGPENPNIDIGTISIPGPISGPRPAVDLPGGMPSKPIMSNQILPMSNVYTHPTLPPLQGGGPRIPRLPPNVNTGISNLGNMLPLQTAQQAGSLVGYGKPADPRMGGVQVAGNTLQQMMRGSFADGGMPEYQGGIMDLESGRQMYFLGKLVKKAKRAVKKVIKSPFGKAALLVGGAGLFGAGPAASLFSGGKGLAFKKMLLGGKTLPPSLGFKSKGLLGGVIDYAKGNPLKTIAAASGLAGLLTSQEEEDEGLDRGEGIDIEAIRNSPYRYLAPRFMADGGRINYSSGSGEDFSKSKVYKKWVQRYEANPDSPLVTMHEKADAFKDFYERNKNAKAEGSKEPVAKETMPLLDMGGKEMDLRAEGGFVPIGRMEKADDVPARLSKNEFVFTADAVRNAGNGNVDKGAEVMYNTMKNLESGGKISKKSQGLEGIL